MEKENSEKWPTPGYFDNPITTPVDEETAWYLNPVRAELDRQDKIHREIGYMIMNPGEVE